MPTIVGSDPSMLTLTFGNLEGKPTIRGQQKLRLGGRKINQQNQFPIEKLHVLLDWTKA